MSPVAEAEKKTVDGVMPIGTIKVKENVRKFFEKKGMEELTENIKKVGVLQPLIVRIVNGHAELIAGERRLRAAKAAGLDAVPVRIIDVDDQAALEIQAFENLHRKDLGPIEEARAFNLILGASAKRDGRGESWSVDQLAERVDKSEAYVYRSLRLLELPDSVLDLIEKGTLTPAHGHQVLRVPVEARAAAAKIAMQQYGGGRISVKSLHEEIDRMIGADLDRAPFPKDKPFAGEVACAVCPFNSGNQGQLFDGAEKGRCMKKVCYDKKIDATLQVLQSETAKGMKGVEVLGIHKVDYNDHAVGVKGKILDEWESKDAKIKALVKQQPGKFGFVIARPDYPGDKAEVRIVAKDPAILPKDMRRNSGGEMQRETARDRFMKFETANHVVDAVAAKITKLGRTELLSIIDGVHGSDVPRRIYARLNIVAERSSQAPDLSKVTSEAELTKTAVLLAIFPWGIDSFNTPKRLKRLGLRHGDIVKAARAKAAKAWSAKKAAKGKKKA